MSKEILVSVSCITYNQVDYIKECLDGFLMQKTNFSYEILIHDDASTDGTIEILQKYEELHPTIFRVMIQKENQYNKGVRGMSATYNIPRAKGKYIALCEGDDYWTDPLKLQKQFDFLEANEEFVACGCYVNVERFGDLEVKSSTLSEKHRTQLDLVNGIPFGTLTLFFRNVDFTSFSNFKSIVGDVELFMYLSQFGDFMKLPFRGAVYRYHGQGVNSSNDYYTNTKKQIQAMLNFNAVYKIHPNHCYKIKLQKYIKKEKNKIIKNLILGRKGLRDSIDFIKFCAERNKAL